ELVTVDSGLVELLDRKLNTLLILYPEIRPGARHREQPADLDDLVLGMGSRRGGEQGDARGYADPENGRIVVHDALPQRLFLLNSEMQSLPIETFDNRAAINRHGRSFRLDVCFLDDGPPFLDLGLLISRECLRGLLLARKDLLPNIGE